MNGRRAIGRYACGFGLYAAAVALYLWYTRANTVPASLQGTAADPRSFLTPEQLKMSVTYSAWRNWLIFIGPPWEWGVYIALLCSGAAARFDRWLRGVAGPAALRLPLYTAAVMLVVLLAGLPWRLASYALSRGYDITTQPLAGWLHDKLVAYGVSLVTTALALAAALWLIRRGGRWWLKLWLLSVPFTLFLMVVQPVLIDPLYDKFERLPDTALERDILQLASKAGVPADHVYEVRMAAKTNAMNAYVNGIGPTLRIVIWDTTLQRLNRDEIMQVMAHEMGHYAMHHLEWSAVGAVASTLALLWIGSVALERTLKRWGRGWGIERRDGLAVVPVILLLVSVLSFVTLPLSNAVSRRAEHAADQFALRLIGSGKGAVSMNQKLAMATLDIVDPPLLVYWFLWDHPTDMERIADAAAYRS
jgi:Zn-dependent protease with chaperone function